MVFKIDYSSLLNRWKGAYLSTFPWCRWKGSTDSATARDRCDASNHHWYGDALEKALEYGGDYPNVLILDAGRCERTFREIMIDAPANDHEAARQFAQGEPMKSRDGTRLLYSRLPVTDPGRGSSDEFDSCPFYPRRCVASTYWVSYLPGTDIVWRRSCRAHPSASGTGWPASTQAPGHEFAAYKPTVVVSRA